MFNLFSTKAKFDAYYDKHRFYYIHGLLQKRRIASYRGNAPIRKTACLYGERYNIYIDISDGVNADIPTFEYCARALSVAEDAAGKPFLYLKCATSSQKSDNVQRIIEEAGGSFRPFLLWHNNYDWYKYVWPRRKELREEQRKAAKQFDIGMAANLAASQYPKPDREDPRVSWEDKRLFGKGSGVDTGYFTVASRKTLHDTLSSSKFSYDFAEKIPYREYLKRSFLWKAVFCPPGIGDYSLRIFDHAAIGQCMIMRETTYDFAHSWRTGIAFVDFDTPGWEDQLVGVLSTYEEWGQRAEHYFETYLTPEAIVDLFEKEVGLFEDAIGAR